jgi:phage-related protein
MALDMTTALTIRARVDGQQQIDRLGQSLGTTTTKANGLAGAFGKLKTIGGSLVGVLGTAGIVAGLKKSIDTFSQFQAETKLLENGLKNVGAQAGQLDKLQKIASDLGEATLFNEEDFRRGFGLLTSFGNIGVESYERVAKAAADVAYTSGTEVSGAFMQLAKALNDPSKGLSALGRSGIQFTEAQKAVIESLQETGNVAEAQRLILVELEKQYGGNAEAAAQGLAGAFDTLGEKFYDLQVALGDNVAQVLQPLIVGLTGLIDVLANLPEPVQNIIVALGGLVVALGALGTVMAIGGPIISALAGLGPLIVGITATIAGWAGAIGPLIASLTGSGGLLAALAAVFTGPVGWIALAVAAGVAIYAFRDQIAAAFKVIGDVIKAAAKAFYDVFIKPVITGAKDAVKGIKSAFSSLAKIITSPFEQGADAIKSIFRELLQFVANGINKAIGSINTLIRGYNSIPTLPDVPTIPQVRVPAFAAGGVVNGPTLAMVGEGGEPEFIIPQSKMAKASANYLSGMRGRSVIPAFADGGVVGPMGGGGAANTTVQITTGPVLQQDGQRYVTVGDLERALQDFGSQVFRNSRSYGGRRYQGAY